MAKDWFNIRVKTEPNKLKHVKQTILAHNDRTIRYYFQQLQQVVTAGADVGRSYIGTYSWVNSKGETVRGRVKTGAMQEGFRQGTPRKLDSGNYRYELGWIDGTPGYAIFQEQGTKNGVKAMHVMHYVQEFLKTELRLLEYNAPKRVGKGSDWKFD